jgi:hypothetical protein
MRITAAVLLFLAVSAGPAVTAETIVGRWGESAEMCSGAMAIDIAPMALRSEEFACEFTDVSRAGDVVTWKGRCFVREEPPRRETVVATLNPDRSLDIDFRGSGSSARDLRRCPR